jgi:Ca2+-transporting ATPase
MTPSDGSARVPGGLTAAEAARRLAQEGCNEIARPGARSALSILGETLREPILLLLVAGTAVYLLLGDVHEAMVLGASVLVVAAITVYQEGKSERALAALQDLTSPRALVIRDGKECRIPGREVVPGDLLVVREGDRVPADAVVLRGSALRVDESLLTGESVPVGKGPWDGKAQLEPPGGEGTAFIYSATLVVQGQGIAEVVATGAATAIGRIGKSLAQIGAEPTPLQTETARAVRVIAAGAALLSALVAVLHYATRGGALDSLLAGITLAMAILPEEIPLVLTVFLALGAWRISRSRVLTRRIPAIEALGSASVLCVDKTGTLTMNRMSVRALSTSAGIARIDDEPAAALAAPCHELAQLAILASEPEAFDPMERAIHALAPRLPAELGTKRAALEPVRTYPLSAAQLVYARLWRPAHGEALIAAKGAPEAILALCRVESAVQEAMLARVVAMAGEGLRVLGVARAMVPHGSVPSTLADARFHFVGLIALADPVRPTVRDALAQCYAAGVRVVMVTGDYPATAQAIAREIGLEGADDVITGAQLQAMDDEALAARVQRIAIFSRVVPEQKLRIVNALKRRGEIVAMTGDGVNDAPALKAAHIGIAMGGRGTDVAREAATLVLLDDDFASIVRAIRLGRRIYANIRNAISYLLAVHVPTAAMAFVPLAFGWPLAFFPVHIVFFEFVIDPACSIVFEAEHSQEEAMRALPRRASERLFSAGTVMIALLQGVSVFAAVAVVYGWALVHGTPETARAMAFVTIVLGNVGLIVVNRSALRSIARTLAKPNPAFWWVVCATLAALGLVVYAPPVARLFMLAPLAPAAFGACAAAAFLSLAWFELYKRLRRAGSSA